MSYYDYNLDHTQGSINQGRNNYQTGVRYNEKAIDNLQLVLYHSYKQRDKQGNRKYNSLQLEGNIPDAYMDGTPQQNINNVLDANQRLRNTVKEFLSNPRIKGWNKQHGRFKGVITKYEHTFYRSKRYGLMYHPHVHMYLLMPNKYSKEYKEQDNLQPENPNNQYSLKHHTMLGVCQMWNQSVDKVFNRYLNPVNNRMTFRDHNMHYQYRDRRDMYFCVPGYIEQPNKHTGKTHTLISTSMSNYRKHQTPYCDNKQLDASGRPSQVQIDGKGIYLRTLYNRRVLYNKDNDITTRMFAYGEAKEFCKYLLTNKKYEHDFNHGIYDQHIMHNQGNYKHPHFVDITNGMCAYYNAKKIYNQHHRFPAPHMSYGGLAKDLRLQEADGGFQNDMTFDYNWHTHQTPLRTAYERHNDLFLYDKNQEDRQQQERRHQIRHYTVRFTPKQYNLQRNFNLNPNAQVKHHEVIKPQQQSQRPTQHMDTKHTQELKNLKHNLNNHTPNVF